jgi:hypothetical protein
VAFDPARKCMPMQVGQCWLALRSGVGDGVEADRYIGCVARAHPLPQGRGYGRGIRRPVSRVLSAPAGSPPEGAGRPFLWDAPRSAPRATNPGGGAGMPLARRPAAPIRSCSRWGLPCRRCCRRRGALLPHRFTLARDPIGARAVCFLWHCPWGRPRRPLTGTAFPWSPDFPLLPGRARRQRPSGRLTLFSHRVAGTRRQPPQACATASRRARVPASAWPVTASGRQWRWKARSTAASAGSSAPSGATR